jgi:hypothetical protein
MENIPSVTINHSYHLIFLKSQIMSSIDNTITEDGSSVLSIEDYKQLWVECEENKTEPRLALKLIGKTQGPARKAIRLYMEENQITNLDCGSGWFMTLEETEKVSFSEDICGPYMEPAQMARLKQEQKKRCSVFKTLAPPKKQRTDDPTL